jgi:hypothetical protein
MTSLSAISFALVCLMVLLCLFTAITVARILATLKSALAMEWLRLAEEVTQARTGRGETEMMHLIKWATNLAGWCALVLLLGWMAEARAQQIPCFQRDAYHSKLMGPEFGELPLFTGTMARQNRADSTIAAFANPVTGTWTVVVLPPAEETNGGEASCLLFSGKDFKPAKAEDFKPKGPIF